MTRPVVLFGTGPQPQVFAQYIEEMGTEVAAFTVDAEYVKRRRSFAGRPLVAFEDLTRSCPPETHDVFIAVGYSHLNRLRRNKYRAAKAAGYRLPSYVSPDASYRSHYALGDNCMILESAIVQPFARIGCNVTMLPGSSVAHHSVIGDHSFLAMHASVAGHSILDERVFLGQGSAVISHAHVGEGTVIGAGAVVGRDTPPESVWAPARAEQLDVDAESLRY